jgi:hypothetical protein
MGSAGNGSASLLERGAFEASGELPDLEGLFPFTEEALFLSLAI